MSDLAGREYLRRMTPDDLAEALGPDRLRAALRAAGVEHWVLGDESGVLSCFDNAGEACAAPRRLRMCPENPGPPCAECCDVHACTDATPPGREGRP